MTDARFQSLYLEGLPRREDFRAARDRLHAACGDHTLAGDLGFLSAEAPPDQLTATISPAVGQTFWLQDGDKLYPLQVGVNSIGRLPDNTVVLKDEHVSRRHCAIVIHSDGQCEVHDIASKNGTILNGSKIGSPTRIRPGDQITLCTRKLTFVTGNTPPAAVAPAGPV